jgi:hypothetical protein
MVRVSTVAAAAIAIGFFQCGPAVDGQNAGCGSRAARDDDGIKLGDGGVWVTGDAGTWFIPSDPFVRPLRALPPLERLCTLRGGNLTGKSDYPENVQGTWLGDVPTILGLPDSRSQSTEAARLTHTFAPPREGANVASDGTAAKQVTLTLTFERVDAIWAPVSDGAPLDNPYFLTAIKSTGIEPPQCWSPENVDSATPCDECKLVGRDFFLCRDLGEESRACYAR